MTQRLVGAARQQLLADARNLYAVGLTIREIAAKLGYSYTATRQMLITAGVVLRPKNQFGPAFYPAGDPRTVDCPKCGALAGAVCQIPYGGRARRTHAARRRKAPAR